MPWITDVHVESSKEFAFPCEHKQILCCTQDDIQSSNHVSIRFPAARAFDYVAREMRCEQFDKFVNITPQIAVAAKGDSGGVEQEQAVDFDLDTHFDATAPVATRGSCASLPKRNRI